MPLGLGVAKHPKLGKVLMFQMQPEPWPDVMGLLRLLKAEFPDEYKTIHYEPIVPNGRRFDAPLILPDSVKKEPEGDEPTHVT